MSDEDDLKEISKAMEIEELKMNKLSRFFKELLDKDIKVLREEEVLNNDLEITDKGVKVVIEHMLLTDEDLRKELVDYLLEQRKKAKKEKKE